MIKLTSICKIYRSNKREKCLALNNINLTLPDSGLVFVLGKSGSGKSTLLNLIGGLDNFTSGTIEVDGNVISRFNERKFCNYRNTHIGFIFQDYHLIDELTVYENIALSLNLRRMKDRGDVALALQKVGLAGYEDRFPTELSGGERQRVAIARAIVKKPRIILADEPTGNLDTATAQSVVGILKTLAQDCLIIVVSHNIHDANTYADRIVELRNGEIISDRTRNPSFAPEVTVTDVNLVYPKGRELSDKDIDLINANQTKKLIKRTDEFIPTAAVVDTNCKVEIERKKLSLLNELHLSDRFLKNKTPTIAVSAFVVAIIMTIMSVANTITAFRPDRIIAEELRKDGYTTMYMLKVVDEETKGMLQTEPAVAVTESDIQAFYDGG
ncbi:MAG: ABC transporter ATP-binding protein, partial [Clostridia bacterium]|nr:ABC transporter ATP-binding protein [Clostridia bacterium]